MTPRRRPTVLQWLGYVVGRPLPPELREWVRRDLTGRWAVPRHLVRGMLPYVPLYALLAAMPLALGLPGTLWISSLSALLAFLLSGFYTFAFMEQNRHRRLEVNGLPPDLERVRVRRAQEDAREAYEHTYREG